MNSALPANTVNTLYTDDIIRQGPATYSGASSLPLIKFPETEIPGTDGAGDNGRAWPSSRNKPVDVFSGVRERQGQAAMEGLRESIGDSAFAEGQAWFAEFENTIGPYVRLTDEEKDFYTYMAHAYAMDGRDVREFAEDFLTANAISNATGLSRADIADNADAISEYLLGHPAEKTFKWARSLINSWHQGVRAQELSRLQSEYRDLFQNGCRDDSPEVIRKYDEIKAKEREYAYNTDAAPHGAVMSAVNDTVEQIPYMGKGWLASAAAGGALTLLGGGPGVAALGATAARFLLYRPQFAGAAFYDMKERGISTETALKVSNLDGIINGVNEAALDMIGDTMLFGMTGGAIKSTLFRPALESLAGTGTARRAAVTFGSYLVGDALGEMFQEASESLTSAGLMALAERMEGLGYSRGVKQALGEAWEEGVAGFTVGLVLGPLGAATATRADVRASTRLFDAAGTAYSREAFVKDEGIRATLTGMGMYTNLSDAAQDRILSSVWEDAAPVREKNLNARADAVSGKETASSEAIRRNQQEPERMPDGAIRHEAVETVRDSDGDGGVSCTVRFASKTARAEGGNATTYGTVKITVSKDGKTAEITDVSIEEPYLAVGAEMVRTTVMDYAPGAEVSWDTGDRADLEALKLAVVSSSPYGTLRFDADGEAAAGLASVRNEILSVLSVSPDEATTLAGLVSTLAKAEGLSAEEFLGRHTPRGSLIQGPDRKMLSEIRRIQEANGYGSLSELVRAESARRSLLTPEQLRMAEAFETDGRGRALHTGAYVSLANGMRGVIYASKASDVSTFVHELFHFAADISPERRAELIKALRETAEDEKRSGRLKEFIRENGEIFMRCSSPDVREAEGIDAKAEAVIRLFRDLPDDGTWGIDAEEAAASLYEAYMAHPRTERLSDKVKQALRKIARWMRDIYKGLREGTLLDQSISDAYNALMGFVPAEERESTQASAEDAPGAREQADSGESKKQGSLPSSPEEVNSEDIYSMDEQVRYQENPDYNPGKVGLGYKLFEMDTRDGKLYPLFLGKRTPTPVGVWLMAEDNYATSDNPVKNGKTGARQFAARPGWHIGATLPDAPWLRGANGQYNSKRGKNFKRVWAEVSYPMDVDYQAEADANASRDIKGHIPENGYYLFNESNRGTWVITGALRVDRVLTDEEVSSILKERGYDAEAAFEPYRRSSEKRAARKAVSPKFQSSFEYGQGLFRSGENPLNEPHVDAGQVLSLEQIETMREVQEENRDLYPRRKIRELSYGMTAAEAWEAIAYATGKYNLIARDAFRKAGIDVVRYETHDGRIEYAYMDGEVRHATEWYETKERLEAEGGHYDGDGNPLAPNGRKSNLTAEQYITVRMPSFKRWFGDWETAPESASKVVDENGEPLVVYHGTSSAGFTEFASQKGTAFGGTPAHTSWFSSSRPSAGTYTFSQDGAYKNGYKDIPEGLYAEPDSAGYGLDRPASRGIYAVFLNARNPIVYDYEGYMADGQPVRKHVLYSGQGSDVSPVRNPDGTVRVFESWSELTDYRNGVLNASGEWLREGEIGYDGRLWTDVRSLWRAEKETGHRPDAKLDTDKAVRDAMATYPDSDGVIFKNIRDSAGYEDRYKGTDYVVYSASQIKSATENTGTFDPANGDIRFQTAARQPESGENRYSDMIALAEKAHPEAARIIEDFGKETGAGVSMRPSFKEEGRSTEKAMADYGGDFRMILDYDGAMLSYGTADEAEAAWEKFKERYGERIRKSKHLITPMGYEDYKAYIAMGNGFIVEVQFLDQPMQDVKDGPGHPLYEVQRSAEGILGENKRGIIHLAEDEREFLETAEDLVTRLSVIEYGLRGTYDDANTDQGYLNNPERTEAIKALGDFVNQYVPVSASDLASSSDRRLPSVPNLPPNLSHSESVSGLSTTDLPSAEGTSLTTPDGLCQSILNGISAISTKYGLTEATSTSNVTEDGAQGNISYQDAQELRKELANGDEALMEAAEGHTIVYTDSDGRLRFQRAWHGTGASSDRFSTEHIGEGEGHQTFGWGLYFTDNKEIARGYAKRIGTSLEETIAKIKNGIAYDEAYLERYRETLRYMSSPEGLAAWNDSKLVRAIRLDERLSRAQHEESDPKGLLTGAYDTAMAVQREHPDASGEEVLRLVWEARLAWLRRHIEDIEGEIKEAKDEIASAAGLGPSAFGHYLYDVKIPDGSYLDWYKMASRKLMVQVGKELAAMGADPDWVDRAIGDGSFNSRLTIEELYHIASEAEVDPPRRDPWGRKVFAGASTVSRILSKLGYVGIRYPANSLSGHSDGTSHNYVIFNDEDVKITSRTRFQEARARGEAVRADLSSIEGVELSADAAVHEEDGLEGIQALWQDSVNAGDSPDTGDASGEASLSLPDVTYVDTSRLKIPGLTGSDATKDRAFLEAMADDEALSALLEGLGDNSDRVEKWVAEIVEAAQERELTAEELDKARDAFNASPRFYRDLIGRIYGRADLRAAEVDEEGQEMAPIATPDEDVDAAYRGISVTQRKRIAGKLSPELAKAFADGTETLDGAVEKELERLEKEGEELEKAKAQAESELAEAKKNAEALGKKLEKARRENSSLSGKLKRRDAKIASLQGEVKDARALEAELARERKKVETRERWLEAYKKSVKEREKKKGDLRKMRAYKQRLARSLSRRWSPSVDFRTVAPILSEIASKLDPRFVRDWAYDPRTNPEGESGGDTISIEDLRKLHDGGSLDESMRAALGTKLWNRLEGEGRKPLNDWTIAELEELNDRLNFQWELGRRREALRRSEINGRRRGYADSIISALRSVPGYDSSVRAEGAERPGGRGARLWRKRYAVLRMQELALKLDGDTGEKGESWHLLVERQRKAHDAELRETDRRTAPVIEAIKAYNKEHGSNAFEAEMYRKAYELELSPGVTQEFTAQALAYAYLAADNVKARDAVAYGNLVDQQEKAAIKRSYDGARMDARMEQEVRDLGDARFDALYAKAKEVLDETGLMPVVDAVKADLRAPENGQRLLDMSLSLFNRPVVLEENYIPLRRTDVTGDEVKSVKDISMATGNYLAKAEDGFMREKLVIAPINQTPARLALMDVWTDSVESQEHLIAYAGLLGDLNSVYEKNRAVTDAIKRAWGRDMLTEIDDYLQYVADPGYGDVRNDVSKVLTALRGSLSSAYLGWKLSGVLVQLVTSPAPFFGEVGVGQLLNGFVQVTVRPGEMREFIEARSVMMRHRSGNMIIEELSAMAEGDRDAGLPERFRNSFNAVGMKGLEWVDWYTVSAGWLAKYNETLEAETEAGSSASEAERKAVEAADEMVLRTQPNGDKTEAARLFRSSNAALRALLQFQASLNVVFNNLTADMRYDWKQRGTDSEAFRRIIGHIAGYAGAGIVLGLIQDGFGDDDDDEDRVARRALKVLYWGLSQGLESVPVVSGNVDDIVNAAVTGEYSAGYRSTSMYPMVSDISEGLSRMLSARTAEEPMEAFLKGLQSFGSGLGYAIGAPMSAIKQFRRSMDADTEEDGIMARLWPFLGRY